jgi:NAD dependent epimerase/dehydratase
MVQLTFSEKVKLSTSSKILVTGADGFIGSHLTEALVRRGYSVRSMVMYNAFNSTGWLAHLNRDIRENVEIISGDVRDPGFARLAVQGCDTVFHLAALIAIPYSYQAPASYIQTNVAGTLNLLEASKDLGVNKFIHTSTSEVYGTAQFVPMTEEHPLNAQSPYAASKIGADQLAKSFYHSFGLPVVTLRPFNTYGPRQSARAVIPTIITQIASGKKQIELGATHPTRDFNYVADTVSGFLAAYESKNGVGDLFNIGSNFEISIGDTAKIISRLMNSEVEFIIDPKRERPEQSEVKRLWAENKKSVEILGWAPNYGGLPGFESGLTKTIEWFSLAENLAKYDADVYNK